MGHKSFTINLERKAEFTQRISKKPTAGGPE